MMCTKPPWMSVSLGLFVISVFLHQRVVASDVTYDELIELKVACGDLDSCRGNRTNDDMRVVNCQCGPICAELGTCCVDSEYIALQAEKRNNRNVATQLYHDNKIAFMVRGCKPDWNGDKEVKYFCDVSREDSFREDLFLSIPVTNIKSGITYGNYYCFACNEDDSFDSPALWGLNLFRDSESFAIVGNVSEVTLNIDSSFDFKVKDIDLWGAVGVPAELEKHVNWYRPKVVSWCDGRWTDVAIKEKCVAAYTALVYIGETLYKNPHCAICNYKRESDIMCTEPFVDTPYGGPPYRYLLSGIFSFEDKVKRCARNEVFDRFSKKCRAFTCGRNQKLVDLQCVKS